MTTAQELREYCNKLREAQNGEGENTLQKEALKSVLNDYFESVFIAGHRCWRAVIGNKRCKPIPIHRDFSFSQTGQDELVLEKFRWPNLSEKDIREELVNLGFVVTGPSIAISVPPYEKGKRLSFAQEWVKKINYCYSLYCKSEKELAKSLYLEFLSELGGTPCEDIKIYDEYALFSGFRFSKTMSHICYRAILALMKHDGIEEFYENGEYKGIKLYPFPS